jgi:signal transduction histidine kinase
LQMRLADGSWVHAVTLIRNRGPQSILMLLLQTLTLYLAVLIPLALVARKIALPLKALTERVGRVGLASSQPPLEPRGPSDVRELIEAFNGAETRLSSLLTEKDVMLGAIGHDLKTPLASLRVRIENVDDEGERDKMAATVDEMVTILDDILVLARLGKSVEEPQQTDLVALVDTVISEFPDNMKIGFHSATERAVALVRPILIRRALRNLVSNALKYGGDAQITIEQLAGRISLVVEDSGPGIPADQIEAIFEPFARAESSRNRTSGGTGLGLTIARAIARAHQGDVKLANRSEGGVRAMIELPPAG